MRELVIERLLDLPLDVERGIGPELGLESAIEDAHLRRLGHAELAVGPAGRVAAEQRLAAVVARRYAGVDEGYRPPAGMGRGGEGLLQGEGLDTFSRADQVD